MKGLKRACENGAVSNREARRIKPAGNQNAAATSMERSLLSINQVRAWAQPAGAAAFRPAAGLRGTLVLMAGKRPYRNDDVFLSAGRRVESAPVAQGKLKPASRAGHGNGS